ncbi:MAG: lipoate--protein ligase family protein [Nanoarchaeota archaeon]|nr:lipoate--protein ligase family protein [Nanoarchaeota archaeon]
MNLEARLLEFEKKDNRFNNALNRAVLESVARNDVGPTLIFTKLQPAVSIGSSQSYALDVDDEACKKYGIDIVRRDSGGQSVYVDKGYLIFYLIGRPDLFPGDLTHLRRDFSVTIAETLKSFGVPAEFHKPDNVIIREDSRIKTIGNSGQVITKDAILVQGSIRYELVDFDIMLDVLRVNGCKLQPYKEEIKKILGEVVQYANVSKVEIKEKLLENLKQRYGLQFNSGELTDSEYRRTIELSSEEARRDRLTDRDWYKSRGVCYFFVGGKNLVPSLHEVMAHNQPSTVRDSTIELENERMEVNT